MALGIVGDPALDRPVCARGGSRAQAIATIRFRAPSAATRGDGQPAAAYREIWFAAAWACAGNRQSRATALGLHFRGRKA